VVVPDDRTANGTSRRGLVISSPAADGTSRPA
jgi:hypothetical protein